MDTLIVKSKQLIVKAGTVIPHGCMRIDNGKITQVQADIPVPEGAKVLDYSQYLIYPGFIDACSRAGINKEPYDYMTETRDGSDGGSPYGPTLLSEDAFDPFSPVLDTIRAFGITTIHAACGPGSLIDGQSASFKLKKAETAREMLVPDSRQMCFTVGDLPVRGSVPLHRPPMTRMSAASMLRSKLALAKNALEKHQEDTADEDTKALFPVLNGQKKARLYCHAAMDLANAVELGRDFQLDYLLCGGFEAWKMPNLWKKHPVPFILSAIPFGPVQTLIKDWYDFSLDSASVLQNAGCPLALTADEVTHTARLPYIAGYLTSQGLSKDDALRSITEIPARFLHLEQKIGTLEPGKDGDFSVWNGDALLSLSRCQAVFVEGVPVYQAL